MELHVKNLVSSGMEVEAPIHVIRIRDGSDHIHGQGISALEHGQAGPDTGSQNCRGILSMEGLDGTPENVQPTSLPKLRGA